MPVPPEHQPDAVLNQVAPIQNVWYTIMDTTLNCRVISISITVATTGETLEARVIIDGQVLTSPGVACGAGTPYFVCIYAATGQLLILAAGGLGNNVFPSFEGRSIRVEVRKTTAAGAGNLIGRVVHAIWV